MSEFCGVSCNLGPHIQSTPNDYAIKYSTARLECGSISLLFYNYDYPAMLSSAETAQKNLETWKKGLHGLDAPGWNCSRVNYPNESCASLLGLKLAAIDTPDIGNKSKGLRILIPLWIITAIPALLLMRGILARRRALRAPGAALAVRPWFRPARLAKWLGLCGFVSTSLLIALSTDRYIMWIPSGPSDCAFGLVHGTLVLSGPSASNSYSIRSPWPTILARSDSDGPWPVSPREAGEFLEAMTGVTAHAFRLTPPCAIFAALTLLFFFLDRPRSRPGHCRNCKYNLTGNTSGICPECGAPIATEPNRA